MKKNDNIDDEYEEVCYICRRPESKVDTIIKISQELTICSDCLQKSFDTINNGNNPYLTMMGMQDIPSKQRVKKKQEKPKSQQEEIQAEEKIEFKDIPAPHRIKEKLDDYIIGQEHAKKVISVAVYNHYKRITAIESEDVEIEKSNLLMIGPTGSGKTYIVKTLAKILDLPLAITDATALTEAGYIGDDVESVLSKLLQAADNNVDKAERGIIFIDEIDKIAKKLNTNSRDVSGESVQQGLLKILEGANIEVPVGATSKNAMVPLTTINTSNILFICAGAFPDLEKSIKSRLDKQSLIGFKAEYNDELKDRDNENILKYVKVSDLREYGMIPEFIGRLPIIFTLQALDKDMLIQVLCEPKNAIIRQYKKLLELDEVDLQFEKGALDAIAARAFDKKIGARALRSILEEIMLDIMYEIPKDDNIGRVIMTEDYILGKGVPIIETRGKRKV